MARSPRVDNLTRSEWRELGFFYDYDAATRTWLIAGSREGLLHFAALVADCAAHPAFKELSQHEHYGPYMYLKIMSWSEPSITDNAIAGTVRDLERLSSVVRSRASVLPPGSEVDIASEYYSGTDHRLLLRCHDSDIDPASLDPLLAGGTKSAP
jgi:hypothetical protein